MLKIKDNVDLKELEKFGFECRKYFYYSYEYEKWGIRVEVSTREIDVLPNAYIDLLYDLIKADLVEKVGE